MLRRVCFGLRLAAADAVAARALHVSAAASRRERHVNKEKYKKEMESIVDTSNLSKFEPEDIGFNEIEKKKGLIKPRHPVDVSIMYLASKAYAETYEGVAVHTWYRRNTPGQERFQPLPRHSCVDAFSGRFRTNNPCPVCRDEYLVLDYRNVALIRQFLDERTGQPKHALLTGLCREEQLNLEAAVLNAQRHGFLEVELPFRFYAYRDWYPGLEAAEGTRAVEEFQTGLDPLPGSLHPTFRETEFIPDVAEPHDMYWKRWAAFTRLHPQGFQRPGKDKFKEPVVVNKKKDRKYLFRHLKRPDFSGFKY